ncbi:unnamed protein product [Bathycoccus prasinos]
MPVPGANVVIQNTTTEVAITGQQTLNVVLAEDASQLEEVVVVGYGSQKRVTLPVLSLQLNLKN